MIPRDLLEIRSIDANGNENTSYTDGRGRTIATEDTIGNLSLAAYNTSNVRFTRV